MAEQAARLATQAAAVATASAGSAATQVAALIDGLQFFGIGDSWGGYLSLMKPADVPRSSAYWPRPGRAEGQLMRIHVGLEDPDDLIADLDTGFTRMRSA